MKRSTTSGILAVAMLFSAGLASAASTEPVEISLLRIEMKKALLQQDAAPKMTQLRLKKWQDLQAAQKTFDAADAEIDYIQAKTAESMANLNVKAIDLQLKDALKAMAATIGNNQPYTPQPNAPQPNAQPNAPQQAPQQPGASPTEIALMQIDLEKAKAQADAANKIAANRQVVLTARQADTSNKNAVTDAQADVLATGTNAQLAALEVEAAQARLDAAVHSASPKK